MNLCMIKMLRSYILYFFQILFLKLTLVNFSIFNSIKYIEIFVLYYFKLYLQNTYFIISVIYLFIVLYIFIQR